MIETESKEVKLFRGTGARRKPAQELMLYGIVGTANTAFGYAVYAFFLYIGWPYQVASLLTVLANICVGFFGQGRLVFKHGGSGRIVRYVVVWVGFLLLFNLIVKVTIHGGYSAYVGGLVAFPIIIPLSFLAQKYYVFRHSSSVR